MDFNFSFPHQLYFGTGTISKLATLCKSYGTRFLIITGSVSFQKTRHFKDLMEQFDHFQIRYDTERIKNEPSIKTIDTITQKHKNSPMDGVIAVGGGSVLDAGKAISAMLGKKKSVLHYLEGVGDQPHDGDKIPFIAVPTTSGTGSEATKNAVISKGGANGFKKSLRHDNFIPDIAIVDPQLTLGCPASTTAACGMDALTQLLESFVSTQASPMTDSLVSGALSVLKDSLPKIVEAPDDIDLRTRLSYSSYISGMALANAGLGAVHGFAGIIGGCFDIPHGIICGTLLAEIIRTNVETLIDKNPDDGAIKKYGQAARLLSPSYQGKNSVSDARYLCSLLEEWTSLLGIPKLGTYGVTKGDIDVIVKQTGQKNNPIVLQKKVLSQILAVRI